MVRKHLSLFSSLRAIFISSISNSSSVFSSFLRMVIPFSSKNFSIIYLKVSLSAKYRFSLLRAGCACLARWRESRAFARASKDLDSDDFSMGLHIADKGELVGEGGLAGSCGFLAELSIILHILGDHV